MRADDDLAMKAFAVLAHNGALAIGDFAQMTGIGADEAEELLVALSAALSDESISTELGYMGASGGRFAWNPRPGGHGEGPKTRLSAGEDAALRDALASFGMCADDPLWTKLFEARGARRHGPAVNAGAEAAHGAGDAGDMTGAGDVSCASGRRGQIVSALSVLASTIDLEEHRLVSFSYRKAGAAEGSFRRVAPVHIVSDGDTSLLQAWRRDRTQADGGTGPHFLFRSYRIDRMDEVRVLDERFDPAALPGEGERGKSREVRLRFPQGRSLPEWPGLKPVKGAGTPDGGVEACISWWRESDWLPQRIAALGGACIPLDGELRERTLSYIACVRSAFDD